VKRKIREVIKEDKGEKDSLLNDFKIKSQAAMEYLMTYGWAILIIALTLAVLYSLGIMNPKNFIPRAPPGSCFVFRPNGPGTTDFVSLQGTCGYLPMYVGSFNGVSGFVQIQNSPSLQLSTVTFGGWVNYKGPSQGYWNWLMAKQNAYGIGVCGSSLQVCFYNWGTGTAYVSSYTLNKNTWYFLLAEVYNGNEAIYVNGLNVYSGPLSVANQQTVGWQIGYGNCCGQFLNGSAANVQIYNTALTPQEIQYLYQQGLGGGPVRLQNLVGWWPLNGDAKDYSGNNLHGTIYGGVTFVQNYNPP